jgi:hypothetical protein
VAFFPTGQYTTHTLKVWKGEEAETLLYSSVLTNLNYGHWNEALITTPVVIEEGEMYWVGLEFNQLNNWDGAAAVDIGPAVAGYGDMVNLGGDWFSTTSAGFDYNWMIRAFVGSNDNAMALVQTVLPEVSLPDMALGLVVDNNTTLVNTATNNLSRSLEILGYNLYRDGQLLNTEPANNATYTDTGLEAGVYIYGVTAVYAEGESLPVERTVQVGGPALSISPVIINETMQAGEVLQIQLTLINEGISQLEWEVSNLPIWISLSETSGTIGAGLTELVTLTINAIGMASGMNAAFLNFTNNNINNPEYSLPVIITIEGFLPAVFDVDLLNFGMVPVLESKLMSVNMTNMTDALLMFQSFTTGTSNFAAYPPTWALQPGQSMSIIITFNPLAIETYIDTLYVQHFGYLGSGVIKLPLIGEGVVMPPSNLMAMVDESTVTLDWLPPGASPDELRFGNGTPYSSIGTSIGTYEFAARFTPVDLMPYMDKQLEKVGFYIHSTNASFNLKVYTGPDANTPLINLPLSSLVANQWNDIELPFPIALDAIDYLWIGYEITQTQVEFIVGVDGGPGITGAGDLLRINGNEWMTIADYGWSHNWNIRGVVSTAQNNGNNSNAAYLRNAPELLGYNVYRDNVQLNSQLVTELSYTDLIEPGETITYGVTAMYNIGESNPAIVTASSPAPLNMPDGWQYTPTPMAHNLLIPIDVLQIGFNLQPGDMLGVFYNDQGIEKAAGAGLWNGQHLVVTAYGNNPATPLKDGFAENEQINWKLYLHQTGTTVNLSSTYNNNMPHYDGTFSMLGLSKVESLETDAVGLTENILVSINAFPNPSTGVFTLSGLQQGDLVQVFDNSGRMIMQLIADSAQLQLALERAGLYLLNVRSDFRNEQLKLIVF